MTHAEMGLIGLLIAVLGLGAGRLWGDARVKAVKVDIMKVHETCHMACKNARIEKESELQEKVSQIPVINRTLEHFAEDQKRIMLLLSAQTEQLSKLIVKFERLYAYYEKNGHLTDT